MVEIHPLPGNLPPVRRLPRMVRLRASIPDLLALAGMALLVAAAGAVAIPLGLAAAGAACLFVARHAGED